MSMTAAERRRALADEIAAAGSLRSPAWRSAVEAVPREAFLGRRIYRMSAGPGPTKWEPCTPEQSGPDGWLDLAYANETWITQFDGNDDTFPEHGLRQGPSSSSTFPGLVVRMLEDLDIRDGDRVLEIGTGTGYSTALLTHRLGGDLVTSVEVDPGIAARAADALHANGYEPRLVVGDGLAGYADRTPYDRIIATCAVRYIPLPWLAQAAPGARILTPTTGWLSGGGQAVLTTEGDGTARGRFGAPLWFMTARAHAAPGNRSPYLPERDGDTRLTRYQLDDILSDGAAQFLAQLAAPNATRSEITSEGESWPSHLLRDHATGAYAWLTTNDGNEWTVTQNGPARIWDDIEDSLGLWEDAGRPRQDQFTLDITPDAQTVRLDAGGVNASWALPAPVRGGLVRH